MRAQSGWAAYRSLIRAGIPCLARLKDQIRERSGQSNGGVRGRVQSGANTPDRHSKLESGAANLIRAGIPCFARLKDQIRERSGQSDGGGSRSGANTPDRHFKFESGATNQSGGIRGRVQIHPTGIPKPTGNAGRKRHFTT